MEHGHSLVIPPYFDGNNYAYWKVRMKAFLKSIDERVWNSVRRSPTLVSEWQTSQKEAVAFNSKAMNAIFNAVSIEEFKRISNVEMLILLGISSKLCMKALRQLILHTTWVKSMINLKLLGRFLDL